MVRLQPLWAKISNKLFQSRPNHLNLDQIMSISSKSSQSRLNYLNLEQIISNSIKSSQSRPNHSNIDRFDSTLIIRQFNSISTKSFQARLKNFNLDQINIIRSKTTACWPDHLNVDQTISNSTETTLKLFKIHDWMILLSRRIASFTFAFNLLTKFQSSQKMAKKVQILGNLIE